MGWRWSRSVSAKTRFEVPHPPLPSPPPPPPPKTEDPRCSSQSLHPRWRGPESSPPCQMEARPRTRRRWQPETRHRPFGSWGRRKRQSLSNLRAKNLREFRKLLIDGKRENETHSGRRQRRESSPPSLRVPTLKRRQTGSPLRERRRRARLSCPAFRRRRSCRPCPASACAPRAGSLG